MLQSAPGSNKFQLKVDKTVGINRRLLCGRRSAWQIITLISGEIIAIICMYFRRQTPVLNPPCEQHIDNIANASVYNS